jgi:hypothetical protein
VFARSDVKVVKKVLEIVESLTLVGLQLCHRLATDTIGHLYIERLATFLGDTQESQTNKIGRAKAHAIQGLNGFVFHLDGNAGEHCGIDLHAIYFQLLRRKM